MAILKLSCPPIPLRDQPVFWSKNHTRDKRPSYEQRECIEHRVLHGNLRLVEAGQDESWTVNIHRESQKTKRRRVLSFWTKPTSWANLRCVQKKRLVESRSKF